jgi:hypothetical protein
MTGGLWQSARAGRIVSAGIATEAANVATSLVKLHPADAPQEHFHPSPVPTDALPQPWLPNGARRCSPRRHAGDWRRFLAVPKPYWQRADSLPSGRFDA